MNTVYEHRVLRRLTQQDLASAVGVSKQTVIAMEKGNYSPSLILGFKVAHYFNVPIEELFLYKPEKDTES